VILELVQSQANWYAGLEVALTRPPGVPERRAGEDPWHPDGVDRPRRIADDLAWFRYAMDDPATHGLSPLDESLPATWDADDAATEHLQRLQQRGVLEATGFLLHAPDLPATA
jgi:hypothetical protein